MKERKKKISIISRESNSKTLDVAMLEAELLKRDCDVTVLSKLLTKEKSLKALGYIGHVAKQEASILASDVVVLDTYCIPASMIPHRRGTKVVQIWHALGAIKKFGWQTVGKEGGSSEKTAKLMKMHHGYDYVVCASDVTAEHFSEAFRTDRNKIVKYGLPRIDYINSVVRGERHDDTAGKILAAYPQLKSDGKKTVLYAPTFRRGKAVDVQGLIAAFDPDKYNIAVKLHPLYRGEAMSAAKAGSNIIFDEEFPSFDWLSVADAIISDYSSLVIESTIADKPLFIYAYDLEEYEANTGLNIDFDSEPIAPYVFRDAGALAEAVGRDDYDKDALKGFRDRYIDIDTGAGNTENYCTAALADFIISLAK
ncbi:MAG: CDP-glycerol glycerophosphotransferase family protein [Mogibacterium sp.]|nr:CDP-glycerol glycerophosphotransferase family protein [Mogibacterium sp.]